MTNKSLDYYRELAARAKLAINAPAAHKTLFNADDYTEKCLDRYYYDQRSKGHGESLISCNNDDVCKYCRTFHINTLKEIDKSRDIELGNNLEKCFQDYFEEKLNSKGLDIECVRADDSSLHMPDLKIVRRRDKKEIAFFEFKVVFRLFISISAKVSPAYKCYSHSQTLDISNGKKLYEQRKLVDGDYNDNGKKIGSTKKLYLPLLEMRDFADLLNHYYKLAKAGYAI